MPGGGERHRYGERVARTSSGPAGPSPGTVARPGRIRTLGPIAVLAVPLGLGLLAAIVLRLFPCEGTACGEPYLGAWGLVLFAVPTALAVGLPWVSGPINVTLALLSSLAAWVFFGKWASQRATQDVDASWWDFWREVAFYAGGVVLGIVGGLLVMVLVLSVL
jgi:hypothetical protein